MSDPSRDLTLLVELPPLAKGGDKGQLLIQECERPGGKKKLVGLATFVPRCRGGVAQLHSFSLDCKCYLLGSYRLLVSLPSLNALSSRCKVPPSPTTQSTPHHWCCFRPTVGSLTSPSLLPPPIWSSSLSWTEAAAWMAARSSRQVLDKATLFPSLHTFLQCCH